MKRIWAAVAAGLIAIGAAITVSVAPANADEPECGGKACVWEWVNPPAP